MEREWVKCRRRVSWIKEVVLTCLVSDQSADQPDECERVSYVRVSAMPCYAKSDKHTSFSFFFSVNWCAPKPTTSLCMQEIPRKLNSTFFISTQSSTHPSHINIFRRQSHIIIIIPTFKLKPTIPSLSKLLRCECIANASEFQHRMLMLALESVLILIDWVVYTFHMKGEFLTNLQAMSLV